MADILAILSTLVIGLLAGSLLTEAVILVPYWRRMEPAEFFRLHGSLGPNLFRYFAPLTILAVGLAVVLAFISGATSIPWVISAVLCLTALAIFFIYFRAANQRFAAHNMPDEALKGELTNWASWHWLRTTIIVIALGTSIFGHTLEGGL